MPSYERKIDAETRREEDQAAVEAQGEEVLTDEERRARRKKKEKWPTAAGVYVSWRPPNWAALNSRRL